jgi:hypothetical protein
VLLPWFRGRLLLAIQLLRDPVQKRSRGSDPTVIETRGNAVRPGRLPGDGGPIGGSSGGRQHDELRPPVVRIGGEPILTIYCQYRQLSFSSDTFTVLATAAQLMTAASILL